MSKHKNTVHLKNLGTPRQTNMASATTPRAKIASRTKIQGEIDTFLAAGGEISRPELQDRTQSVKPRFDARCGSVE